MQPIIEISQLDFAYGEQLALKQINLVAEAGDTLGLIGPNGAGKSTLIKLLLGLLKPTRGTIRIAGLPPQQAIARGDIVGYLPQNPMLHSRMPLNVRQVVQLGLVGKTGMLRWYRKPDLDFVEELMQRIGIADQADQPVGELSGGRLQRVLIARALAPKPQLLLLDEPTTGIDRLGQKQFVDLLLRLKEQMNLTVVFVSHDLRAVSAISDRIACLNVTLHYHDVPRHVPTELIYSLFACDLDAIGMSGTIVGGNQNAKPATAALPQSVADAAVDDQAPVLRNSEDDDGLQGDARDPHLGVPAARVPSTSEAASEGVSHVASDLMTGVAPDSEPILDSADAPHDATTVDDSTSTIQPTTTPSETIT
jgi:zinc transport system ATP-binding protein